MVEGLTSNTACGESGRTTNGINRRDTLILVFLCSLAACTFLIYLDQSALYYDEAIYGQVAKETAKGNHWITLHWNGQPWFHKPPLYFWTTAILFKIFGTSEFVARALSALAGVGCVALSYVITRHLYGRTSAILSPLIVLTSSLFVVNARRGMTDVLMTAFTLLAVYAYLLSARKSRYWMIVGVACGFAVLTKGAAGLLAPVIIVIALLADRRRKDTRKKEFWNAVAAFVSLSVPWHLVLIALHGSEFVNSYFFRHILERSTSDLHHYEHGPTYYVTVLWQFFWPWVILTPLMFVAALRQRRSMVVLIQAFVPLVLFSFSLTKFNWYIVPTIPAFAILIAFGTVQVLERTSPIVQRLGWIVILVFVLAGALATFGYSKPNKQIEAVTELMPIAAGDSGGISASPESLEMTVLYYTDRKLCADPVISPLSFRREVQCMPGEIRNFVYQKDRREFIESRFGPLRVIAESGDFAYGEVTVAEGTFTTSSRQ